ncbi:cell surface glycoprotein (s-layer protein)-like protein [Anaeramoeba flamelloides]|uniref:Cell surface glycoprotein (S-layer protein)-like protein n=1 Tax=Anaeramoeba flamelloides TaxID=1746091 RepID=A0AAV8ABL4_9EUKA|nr:cell surface glycoprotein (s-layer protein)-like protein [Anaeramoeba flamelloides]
MNSTQTILLFFFLILLSSANDINLKSKSTGMKKTSYLLRNPNKQTIQNTIFKAQLKHSRIREDGSYSSKDRATNQLHVGSQPIGSDISNNQKIDLDNLQIKNNQEMSNHKTDVLVDPLVYSSLFAGSDHDTVRTFSVGSFADSYTMILAGTTNSPDFPKKNGINNVAPPRKQDNIVFITRFDSIGNIIFSTYFGGSSSEKSIQRGVSIVPGYSYRDSVGRFWITGNTNTPDLPLTKNAYQSELFDINTVGFILCLNNDGNTILYSSLLGDEQATKTNLNHITGIQYDNDYYILVGGSTNCSSEIYKNELQIKDPETPFLYLYLGFFRITNDETTLCFGTVFGGSGKEVVNNVAFLWQMDETMAIWITGQTNSTDFFQNYNRNISTNVNLINETFVGNENMGYFLRIIFNFTDTPNIVPELKSGSFIGNKYEDQPLWIQPDYTLLTDDYRYDGPIYISGYTNNFDYFLNNTKKPNWMHYTKNDGTVQVGFLLAVDHLGENFTMSLLLGCVEGETSIFYNYPHHYQNSYLTGYSNCNKKQLNFTDDIWNDIEPNNNINDFDWKFFMINANLTRILDNTDEYNYYDLFFFSSFVDGIDFRDYLDGDPSVKVDLFGNIYSIFNMAGKNYKNPNWTQNAFMIETFGESSIIIRVYGSISCSPGSSTFEGGLCISCPKGQYSTETNSKECKKCDPGFYQDKLGSTTCKICSNNTDQYGLTECISDSYPKQIELSYGLVTYESIQLKWDYTEEDYDYQLSVTRPIGLELLFIIQNPEIIDGYFAFNLSGLIPSNRYYLKIRVKGNQKNNFSSWSSEILVTTSGPPNRVHKQSITCSDDEPYSIDLTWSQPVGDSDSNITYTIQYQLNSTDSDASILTKSSLQTYISLTDLNPDEEYIIKIIPINDAGEGFASVPKTCQTKSQVPDIVTISSFVPSDNTLELEWARPNNNGKAINNYEIKYRIKNEQTNTIELNLETEYTLTNLDSDSEYEVTIIAINDRGPSNDDYKSYFTKKNTKSSSTNLLIITSITASLFGIFIITLFAILLGKKKIIRMNKRNKIKQQVKNQHIIFNTRFSDKIFNSEETITFSKIDKSQFIYEIAQDIKLNNVIHYGKYCIAFSPLLKNKIAFCKTATILEVEIHNKIWDHYNRNPFGVPAIQILDSAPLLEGLEIGENNSKDQEQVTERSDIMGINNNDRQKTVKNKKKKKTNQEKKKLITKFSESEDENNLNNLARDLKLLSIEYHPLTLFQFNEERKKIGMAFKSSETTWITLSLLGSLKMIHGLSIIHRDIKPQNILIGIDGHLRISDFSSARILKNGEESIRDSFNSTQRYADPHLMNTQMYDMGDITYEYNPKNDIFSLGKTLSSILWDEESIKLNNSQNGSKKFTFEEPLITKINDSNLNLSTDEDDDLIKQIISKCLLPIPKRPGIDELYHLALKAIRNVDNIQSD